MSRTADTETLATGPLGLPRTFWLLWTGTLVNRLGGGVFPFLALYLTRSRGISAELAGLAVGLYAAGGMVAGPVGGTLCDRVGRRPALLVGTAVAAAAMVALGLADTRSEILVCAPLLGFFTDLCRPALQAAVADVVPPADRARAYGLLYWAINLGFSGAAVLAGILAEWSFALLFAIDAATTLAFGAMVLIGVPETRPAEAPGGEGGARLLVPFRDRALMVVLAIQVPVLLVFQQGSVALPLDMGAHGLTTAEVGRLLAVNGITIILLQPLAIRFAPRVAAPTMLAVGAALTGVGFGLAAVVGHPAGYAGAIVVLTIGEIAFSTATPALIAELAPARHRGAYQGAHQLAWGACGVLAPIVGPAVMARHGAPTLWVGCLAAGLGAAALHAVATGRVAARGRGGAR